MIIILIALFFAHMAIPENEMQWAVGWGAKNLIISALCFMVWRNELNPRCQSAVAVLGVVSIVSVCLQAAGITLDLYEHALTILACLFSLWVVKQYLLMTPPNDHVPDDEYVYALAPVRNTMSRLNILSPSNIVEYGGRVLIAGDHVYCVHRNKFKKIKLSETNHAQLELYKKVRSGVKLNQKDSARLDQKLSEKVIIGYNDCSTLTVGAPLGYILLKRKLSKVFRHG